MICLLVMPQKNGCIPRGMHFFYKKQRIAQAAFAKAAPYVCDLICYYPAHRRVDTDWAANSFHELYQPMA